MAAMSVLPVGVVGGINSPELAEKIIAGGKADFVLLARQLLADPEFPNKAQSGHGAEIRRCLRCYTCFPGSKEAGYNDAYEEGRPRGNKMGSCTINPRANLPISPEDMPQPRGSRRVLVIGGGVAGMQAAITAADRGHKVTLAEKSGKLGGILNFTDMEQNRKLHKIFEPGQIGKLKRKNRIIKCAAESVMQWDHQKQEIKPGKRGLFYHEVDC